MKLYINSEDMPANCVNCPYYNKYKYCNLLGLKVEKMVNYRHNNCPLHLINEQIEFYIYNLKALIASYNQLLSVYEFIELTAEEYSEKAKNLI